MTAPISTRHAHAPVLQARRHLRLRREIALLEQMDSTLWKKAILCAGLAVPLLAGLMGLVAAKLHWFGFHPLAVIGACLCIAMAIWWSGRYSLFLPLILVVLIVSVLSESIPDIPFDTSTGGDGGDESKERSKNAGHRRDKAGRRAKIASALARRRAILSKLEAAP